MLFTRKYKPLTFQFYNRSPVDFGEIYSSPKCAGVGLQEAMQISGERHLCREEEDQEQKSNAV